MLAPEAPRRGLHARPLVYHAEPGTTPVSAEKRLVLERVPAGARVLEVGAHSGYFSSLLAERGCRVTALEVDPRAAALATAQAERVVVGDVEDPAVWAQLSGRFDVLLFMHVLEHLVDPWAVLRRAHDLVAPGGRVLALLPNVACWRVRRTLFFAGEFEYEETGILDRTHLRFFTLASARALFESTGWDAPALVPMDVCVPLERRLRRVPLARRAAGLWHRVVAGRFPNLCTEIVLIDARARAGEGA